MTTNIYYLTVSMDQVSRNGLAGLFWLRISLEVAVRMFMGAASSEGLPGAGLRTLFQDGSLTWLLAGGLHSCWLQTGYLDPLEYRTAFVSSQHGNGFSQSE